MLNFSLKQIALKPAPEALALLGAPEARAADSDILFVLNGSGAMWGPIDGVAKAQLGLMTYSAAPGTQTTPPRARQA